MAELTESQLQGIVDGVLSSIRTNALPILSLTPVKEAGANDWLELDGGRRIAATDLVQGITGLAEVWRTLYLLHASVTLTATPSTIERGVPTDITLRWGILFGGGDVEGVESLTLTEDGVPLGFGDTALRSTVRKGVDSTRGYILRATLPYGVTKTAVAQVAAYYPIYIGSSAKDPAQLTSADILGFKKQGIRANPSGTYTMTVAGDAEYIYICVPEGMAVTKATMGGQPMVLDGVRGTVQVEGKGTYTACRTAWRQDAGPRTFTLEGTGVTPPKPDPSTPAKWYTIVVDGVVGEDDGGDPQLTFLLDADKGLSKPTVEAKCKVWMLNPARTKGRYANVTIPPTAIGEVHHRRLWQSAVGDTVTQVDVLTPPTAQAAFRADIHGGDGGRRPNEVFYEWWRESGDGGKHRYRIQLYNACAFAAVFTITVERIGGTAEETLGQVRIPAGQTEGHIDYDGTGIRDIWVGKAEADGGPEVRFIPFYEDVEDPD